MFSLGTIVMYVLLWGSWSGMGMGGYEVRELGHACEVKAKIGRSAVLLKVVYAPNLNTNAVICSSDGCADPYASVNVERIDCAQVPQTTRQVVEPSRWEER